MPRKKKVVKDVLTVEKQDRRLLSNVDDKTNIRTNVDRRGKEVVGEDVRSIDDIIYSKKAGIRYNVNYAVEVSCKIGNAIKQFNAKAVDISTTGILLRVALAEETQMLQQADEIKLKFEIIPGSMPEGFEMKVNIKADLARVNETDNGYLCGFSFAQTLSSFAGKKKDRVLLFISSLLLLFISVFIVMMRVESVLYFKFNKYMYLYSIIAAVFLLSRYLFGTLYKIVPIDPKFTPGVTIIIPCFNEEEWIQRTILSCANQDYPVDKLEVIVVDDCSNDLSREKVKEIVERLHNEAAQFDTKRRIKYIFQPVNKGKREVMAVGCLEAMHELVVFVDSDSFLEPFAIRNLVQPFKDPKMGGVSGRTDVANTYTNGLTKMQSVRYYIAFRIMKAAEAYFDAVTCLSGPLACYKKEIVLENMEAWLNQTFFGQRATFGDDRSMTNFVLRHHRTGYQDSAVCYTIVPNRYNVFLKQQMRWKRSWLRESTVTARFIWRKEPMMAVSFYMGLVIPVAAPIIVLYNLIYVPIVHHVFPTTFLIGLLMMSLLMSIAQMLLRKSSTWIFGMLFCFYYEAVLLWQMPVAWFTFWKSTWGTRMTPQDVLEQQKKDAKKAQKKKEESL